MAKFRIETLKTVERIVKELATGLRALTFGDNFDSFETDEITLASGASTKVRNRLTIVPTRFIIIWAKGEANIGASDTTGEDWSNEFIYLKNYGSNTATFRVIIMR